MSDAIFLSKISASVSSMIKTAHFTFDYFNFWQSILSTWRISHRGNDYFYDKNAILFSSMLSSWALKSDMHTFYFSHDAYLQKIRACNITNVHLNKTYGERRNMIIQVSLCYEFRLSSTDVSYKFLSWFILLFGGLISLT